jgi:hypothetical protein
MFRLTRKVDILERGMSTFALTWTEKSVRRKWKSPLVEYKR